MFEENGVIKKQKDHQKGFSAISLVLIIVLLAVMVIGALLYWQKFSLDRIRDRFEGEFAKTEISKPRPSPADKYKDWLAYLNDVYGYKFRYPEEARVEEVEKAAFSLSPEEVSAGMTFDEKYEKYTGKICLTIFYQLGYIQISAPPNAEFAQVICGRTGLAYEGEDRSERVRIDDKVYTATGFEEKGPGETLNFHNETLVVTLDDGTRIEYGSRPDEAKTFADYLEMKEEIIKVVESYRKI